MDLLPHLISLFSNEPQDNPTRIIADHLRTNVPVTAPQAHIDAATRALVNQMPEDGRPTSDVLAHILEDVAPGLARGSSGPRFFGFVTGGALPTAQCADILTTIFDQNVQVHLPDETVCTALEHRTLQLVLDLFGIPRESFTVGSLTSGATGSNILGLACGRDAAIQHALSDPSYSTGDDGIPSGIKLHILTDQHHASIEKAAALVGIGRRNVKSLHPRADLSFAQLLDHEIKQLRVQEKKVAVIVVASFAEVNTGDFTDLTSVRDVCDRHGAWLHIDAAFGAMACLLPEYAHISHWMAQADSLTSDGHKWFNVPYACGIFYCRSRTLLTSILAGNGAQPAYLSTSKINKDINDAELEWATTVPSPLHTNIENSRRFIALPLYAALLAMGRKGYADIVRRNVQFARDLAEWMCSEEEMGGGTWFEVLNLRDVEVMSSRDGKANKKTVPLNVVLFRPRDTDNVPTLYRRAHHPKNQATSKFVYDVNATKKTYVSPGAYATDDGGAVRIAVSNWITGYMDNGADLESIKGVLTGLMRAGGGPPTQL